ncbi:MAG: hypothetical protein LBG58_12265 [Planctomycetaceae bacterium]|jgi:hypothetical protein|nr:hypothetical protein [Planctomycetaceae bacterium]
MKRLTILILLFLSGCQSMPHEQEPTVLVNSRPQQQQPQSGAAERFLARAAHFLRGVMPETENVNAQENPNITMPKPPVMSDLSRTTARNPSAFYLPQPAKKSRPGSIQASQLLFNFDFEKNEPNELNESVESMEGNELSKSNELNESTVNESTVNESIVNKSTVSESNVNESNESKISEPATSSPKHTAKSNVLQPQNGDSESFRQLLKLIAKTPKENRGVDDDQLKQLLAKFRNENWEEMPELEISYLVHLRNKILPDYRSPKKLNRKISDETVDETIEEEDEFYTAETADHEKHGSAPLPPSKPSSLKKSVTDSVPSSSTRTLSKYVRQHKPVLAEENRQEMTNNSVGSRKRITDYSEDSLSGNVPNILPPSVFASTEPPTLPKHSPPPHSPQPVYPKITQLEGSQPIVPAGYQTAAHPPYANQHGILPESSGHHSGNNLGNHLGNNIVYAYANSGSVPVNTFNNKEWESLVRMGADQLRNKIEQTPHGRTFANESRLRLLEMILGNRNEAVKPIAGVDKPINEFMANQMLGFTAFLDEAGIPEQRIRNTSALFRFDESLMELRKVCPIKLKNVQFVKKWETYGWFIPQTEDCRAGEQLELYMELENPTVRQTQQGFNVSASVSYEIRDRTANVLQKVNSIAVEETTPSQKRDYCIGLRVLLPEKMTPGQYQLRVSVTDMNDEAMPYAEEQVPFKIVPVASPEN